MKVIPCPVCSQNSFTELFSKKSSLEETFTLVTCNSCNLVFINPQPSWEEVEKYYHDEYFTKRTDRGYDNYYSESMKKEISRVFQLNLEDLGYFQWFQNMQLEKKSLDIGCAAGYFVEFMKNQGFAAQGIEMAKGPAHFAKTVLGLDIIEEDFLSWDPNLSNRYSVITLWATIEHLHNPKQVLEKAFQHLHPGGVLIVSTCRYGILAKWKNVNWRFLNVPEHLVYFSLSGILKLLQSIGFQKKGVITYGSGMTSQKQSGIMYKLLKFFLDRLVKLANQGDMMAVLVQKPVQNGN